MEASQDVTHGAPWVTPYITVVSVESAIQFYTNAFDFKVIEVNQNDQGAIVHAELEYNGQLLMLGKQGAFDNSVQSPIQSGVASPIILYVYCEDVDDFYDYAVDHGAISVSLPQDTSWGDRMCRLQDPDAYHWCFATYVGSEEDVEDESSTLH